MSVPHLAGVKLWAPRVRHTLPLTCSGRCTERRELIYLGRISGETDRDRHSAPVAYCILGTVRGDREKAPRKLPTCDPYLSR